MTITASYRCIPLSENTSVKVKVCLQLTTLQAGISYWSSAPSVPVVFAPPHQVALCAVQWCHFLFAAFSAPQPKQRDFAQHAGNWNDLDVPVSQDVSRAQSKRSVGGQFEAQQGNGGMWTYSVSRRGRSESPDQQYSWRNPVSPSRVQKLVTQLLNPPAMRSTGLPLMYRAGLSLVCVQVRHSEYHCDTSGLIRLVVHSIPNSQTTKRSHFPPTPSSVYWAAGWRYMKAVHVEEAAT